MSWLASLPHQIPFRAASDATRTGDQTIEGVYVCTVNDAMPAGVMAVEAMAQLGGGLAFVVGNVSLRVKATARPDTYEVQGRGELQLGILVEMMRREGFELTVGQPHVVEREIDGKRNEPVELCRWMCPRSTSAPSLSCWPRARAAWST